MAGAAAAMGARFGFTRTSVNDLGLAAGVVVIIGMLIVPLPPLLLDFGLVISITLSVMILMTALFIEKPLQLSTFPTILLIATMLRLGLNLASTRLILAHGHEGSAAAGGIIEAFGTFLMGGETIIGLTIFVILIIINFVVITKGAGRIAEVAARFSLDAMPGKQMAIDADLSSGLIDETQARLRRSELEAESGFFGAMDGASKFVRGDAVAGLIITAVNIVVGLIIGVGTKGIDIGTAFHSYTILTVGDGLVSQIPALIVSTAAGLLVTKGTQAGKTEAALVDQLSRHPKAMGVASAMLGVLSLMPGMPFLPFAALAGLTGWGARSLSRRAAAKVATAEADAALQTAAAGPTEEPIGTVLAMDQIRIELGYALLGLVNDPSSDNKLTDQIRALRRQLAADFGFVMPSVRILDNLALGPNDYLVFVKETEVARGELRADKLLVMHPAGDAIPLPGEPTREPAFGMDAMWVDRGLREDASLRGLTVVDATTVITTHLTEVVKDNVADLLSYAETQKLIDELPRESQKLVSDLVPTRMTLSTIQRVLQNLLSEGVSIRDLSTILEGLAEASAYSSNVVTITEHVRARLARQISAAHQRNGSVPLVTLSPDWEQRFAESLVGQGDERQLAMPPSQLQMFIASLRESYDRYAAQGEIPCLLTSPVIRPFVRSIVERFRPATVVLSQNEIHPRIRVRALGAI